VINMSFPWYTHSIIYRILNFNIVYKAESPLRIGSGKATKLASPIDMPVITVKFGEYESPYIPGSSIKGVFRSASEYVAKSVGIKNVCERGDGCKEKYDKLLQDALRELRSEEGISKIINILKNYCIICKSFGSGTFRSHIDFHDAYSDAEVSRSTKVGIAIDRRSGAAKRRALFTIEYVNPGSIFKGSITLINIPNYIVGLLANVIDMVNNGIIKFGSMKSKGFGKVAMEITKVSGYTIENSMLKEIIGRTMIKALDEYDINIELDPSNLKNYFNKCKEAWAEYVKKIGS